jgi:hypothetical protein
MKNLLDPKQLRWKHGIPHPLSKFALNGPIQDSMYADVIVEQIWKSTGEDGESARWFLFESEKAFFAICAGAGVDAVKLRAHLFNVTR